MGDWLTYAGHRAAIMGLAALIAAFLPPVLLITPLAQAAGFDCAKAGTRVEEMICADAELSALDEALGEEYARVLAQAADQNSLKAQQRTWLRDIRDACTDATCLKAAYEARMIALANADEATGATGGEIVRMNDYGNPLDADGLPIGPGDAMRPSGFEYSGAYIQDSRDEKLCKGILIGLRQHSMSVGGARSICGVPFPRYPQPDRYAGFSRVPTWRNMDAAENMDLVKEFLFWANMREKVVGKEDMARQRSAKTIIPEIFDNLWAAYGDQVKALVAAGRVELQRSQFDYDNDGRDETVYRMVTLYVRKSGEPLVFQSWFCRAVVPGWSESPMSYMVEKDGQHYWLDSGYSLFRYEGKTYRFVSNGNVDLLPVAPRVPLTICRFTPAERKEVWR